MKINFKISTILILVFSLYLTLAYFYVEDAKQTLVLQKYSEVSKDLKSRLSTLITAKQEAISLVALSLSINDVIKHALITKETSHLSLAKFSRTLSKESPLKNVWFQLIDTKGISIYRSWTSKSGDSLKTFRKDVTRILQEQKVYSLISVGRFDISFKTLVPIYHENKFIGILETIAKFNSIALKMSELNSDALIVIDKSYKNQLIEASQNRFIDDYYIANTHPNMKILHIIKERSFKKILHLDDYFIDKPNNLLFTTYEIHDLDSKTIGYFILSKDLSSIDTQNIDIVSRGKIDTFIIVGILLLFFIYSLFTISYKKFVRKQHQLLEKKVESKTKELYHVAHHDSLTGLPNRLLFLSRLEHTLKSADRRKQKVAVVFLDLDKFKEVNDTYGHEIGDKLLIEVTERLLSIFRREDTVARLGGDEFTVILQDISKEEIHKLLNKIIAVMQQKIVIDSVELNSSFSIGVSFYPEDSTSSDKLLKNADTAMYKAKKHGKNAYAFYND